MADFTRRLPVYLLLDCSGSMMGEPIEAVRQGVKALLSELRGDPQALETAYLSVITFDSQARQIIPLTELMSFKEPEINAGGATALGGALNVLIDCVNSEVRKSTETQKGDWRPLVFILTDGSPTDVETFREAAQRIKGMKAANIIACAAGSNANTSYLKEITESMDFGMMEQVLNDIKGYRLESDDQKAIDSISEKLFSLDWDAIKEIADERISN